MSGQFPVAEKYGLTSQIRRSAVSVPANISEGAGRGTNRQFRIFLEYALGSINEVQTQIELAFRIQYVTQSDYEYLIGEAMQIYKMILTFYNSLKVEY